MATTLAFDLYGTLVDTDGVVPALRRMVGERAEAFSCTWREKQLEYSFRRGLMRDYADFDVCTSDAFDYACAFYRTSPSPGQRLAILEAYRRLPTYVEVSDALAGLAAAGFRLYVLSNGSTETVEGVLRAAGVSDHFLGVVSVEDLRTFKPDPAVYSYFLAATGASRSSVWLVSSNPFDVIGAVSAGMRAAWVRRSPEVVFDPWGREPTVTVADLSGLSAEIAAASA